MTRLLALATAGAALGDTAAKVDLAAHGELGLPGFPAPARPGVDPGIAQLGNAALGVVGALLALAVLRRWPRAVEVALAVAPGGATLAELAGAVVLAARVLQLTDGFGALPTGPGPWLGAGYALLTAALFAATTVVVGRRALRAAAPPCRSSHGRRADAAPPAPR